MKLILKPAVTEEAQYFCDMTGKVLENGPAMTIVLHCGYGSGYDGSSYELHLGSEASPLVEGLIRCLILGGGPLDLHESKRELFFNRPAEPKLTRRDESRLRRDLRALWRRGYPSP